MTPIVSLFFIFATAACVDTIHFEVCDKPYEPGNCTEIQVVHTYYDSKQKKCIPNFFSGCPGNDNFFDLVEECESRCIDDFVFNCSETKKKGTCSRNLSQRTFTRWHYNEMNDTCESFQYSGCEGNSNRFLDREECDTICRDPKKHDDQTRLSICETPMDAGKGNMSTNNSKGETRFYFDLESMECKEFYYFGAGGNSNNFFTKKRCQNMCSKDIMNNQRRNEHVVTKPTKDPNNGGQLFFGGNVLHILAIVPIHFLYQIFYKQI